MDQDTNGPPGSSRQDGEFPGTALLIALFIIAAGVLAASLLNQWTVLGVLSAAGLNVAMFLLGMRYERWGQEQDTGERKEEMRRHVP